MKKLKFRVLNKNLGRFVNSDEWFLSLDGKLMFFSIGDGIPLSSDKVDRLIECDSKNYIIQQYTGVKDIDGNEIYEGDIIKVLDGNICCLSPEESPIYDKGEITWLCESWKICQVNIGAAYLSDYIECNCHNARLKVIGNILQNNES